MGRYYVFSVLVLLRLTYVVFQCYENASLVEGGLNPSTPWIRYWCQHILLRLNAILLSFAICDKSVFDFDIQIWCFTFCSCASKTDMWYEIARLVERGLNPSTPWIRYWCQHILLHLNAILLSFAICGKPVFDGDIQIWCFTFDNCWCFALQSHPRMLTSSVKTYEVIISFIFLLCCVTITFEKDFECFTASWNYIFIWESFSSIISTKRLSSWIQSLTWSLSASGIKTDI